MGSLEPAPCPLLIERRLSAHTVCQEILVAVVSNFNTVFLIFFLTRNTLTAVETALLLYIYIYIFRHLLGCVIQLFLPSKYYTAGVLHIPSDSDDPWKLKSSPKKNEYFEYLNKFTVKNGLS